MEFFWLQTQTGSRYFRQSDVDSFYTVLIIVGAIVVFAIIAGFIRNQGSGGSKKRPGSGPYRRGAFRRQARKLGLAKAHINTLEHVIKRYRVQNPNTLLKNSPYLDRYLKRLLADLDMMATSPGVKEAQKNTVFRIKQIIERNSRSMQKIAGTRSMSAGQSLALSTLDDPQRLKSQVISNLKDVLAVEIPLAQDGIEVRWKKWTPVQGHFWKKNGQAFSFQTKITGYSNIHGGPCLFLQHSKTAQQTQQRRFRRRELDRPSYFYPVKILTSGRGRKATKRAFVDTKRRALGTVVEVSAGGCSVKTSYPLNSGELIKLQFDTAHKKTVTTFGKVRASRKIKPMGGIMHIMFTRVSKAHLNQINAFVYNFDLKDVD